VLLVPHPPDGGHAFTIMDGRIPSNPRGEAANPSPDTLTSVARSAFVDGDVTSSRRQGLLEKLSSREREVVAVLLSGNRAPAIAGKLHLSPATVRNHLSNAFRKLRVGNQQELIDLLR
jgi:DNA-binding NarL/FixJ family response regulator